MYKILLLFIFALNLTLGCNLSFAGGDLVNNGGGLSERNVLFAYNNLEFSIRLCLDSSSCRLSIDENKLLRTLFLHLKEERQNQNQILFISEKQHPGTFLIDGEMKAAVTGGQIGSVIYINTDLLYFMKKNNLIEGLSVNESVAMLVHELGHHYGSFSHTSLDLLGLKVSHHLEKSTYQTPLLPGGSPISALFINGEAGSSFPEILLYAYQQMFNLTDLVENKIGCQLIGLPLSIGIFPPLTFPIKKPRALLVHNVYWEEIPRKLTGVFKIKGSLTSYCELPNGEIQVNRNHKIIVSFVIKNSPLNDLNKLSIDQKTINISQVKDPWLRLLDWGIF